MQLHLFVQLLLHHWQQLKEQSGVMYWVLSRDLNASQSFLFFSLPSKCWKALNLLKLPGGGVSWTDFLSRKIRSPGVHIYCCYLTRSDVGALEVPILRWKGFIWILTSLKILIRRNTQSIVISMILNMITFYICFCRLIYKGILWVHLT